MIILGPQLVVAGLTVDARDAANEVFQPVAEGGAWVPDATPPPIEANDPDFAADPSDAPDPSSDPSLDPTASASAAPAVPRVNVLLIGMDSGIGRNTLLSDTMIVVSLDPVGKTVSMASIPRDMVDVPLPDGRKFRGKINSLVSYARWHPGKFPGAKDGQSVLAAALGTLLDLKIDSWAQVNLPGFVSLVDAVGGVNINVTDGFCDPRYKEYGIRGFNITPGRYHMDGEEALAYARVRKATGESDFTRAGRQQEVIAALRDKMVRGAFLDNPSRFLRSIGQTITTNIRPSFIADYIGDRVRHRAQGRLPRGHRPSAREVRLRRAWVDPGPAGQEDPGARGQAVHAHGRPPEGLRHDARRRQRPDEERVQVVDVRDPAEAQGDAEAHAQADPQADEAPEGDAEAHARAVAVRGRTPSDENPPAAGG